MKKLISILGCVTNQIKKKFFNVKIDDISHDCKSAFGIAEDTDSSLAENEIEEYMNSYKSTTRWQTL